MQAKAILVSDIFDKLSPTFAWFWRLRFGASWRVGVMNFENTNEGTTFKFSTPNFTHHGTFWGKI